MKHMKGESTFEIMNYCKNFLEVEKFADYCYNGIQYQGSANTTKIALGVSASKKFLKDAVQWGADLAICHHGIIFGKIDRIDHILSEKIKLLALNNMSLAGFHLPLDAHPEVGNNIALCALLGLRDIQKTDIGFTGSLPAPMLYADFYELIQQKINKNIPFAENFGSTMVSKVCVISGGASGYWRKAHESGADTFVFGELKESSFHEMKEAKLNFIAAGHYATEKLGVQKLGAVIAKNFPAVDVQFFEEYCPV